jgi:hypothetical protein
MAVFFDTGGGDIYGGASREAVIEAMRDDIGEDFVEADIEKVSGTMKMLEADENDAPTGELITLDDAFTEGIGAYCVASENC